MNYVISNFTEYKFVLSENKKDVFQAHFTVLHCYDNLCTDYFERNLSFISDKKKPILFEVGGEVVAKSVLECTQYSECRGRRLANKGHFQNMLIAVASGKNFPHWKENLWNSDILVTQ